ncbi:MAG: hypothetical protein M0042_16920 [Nitrospiraceae bacterium]|nr:hypothetical protein [Nitrospiraceae bacterium]
MKIPRLLSLFLVFCATSFLSCGSGSSGNSDCAEFKPPAKTGLYGESCATFYYGTCPTGFDDCSQGTCQGTANGSICTKTCSANADCSSGYYCVANNSGTKVCTKGCASHTYCDGTTCCSYQQDPANPTTCKQTSCTMQADSLPSVFDLVEQQK